LVAVAGRFGQYVGRFLGRISFTLFLIHLPLIRSLRSWLVIVLLPPPIVAPVKIAGSLTIIIVIAAAAAIYRIVDQEPTKWSRSVGYAIDSRFSVASADAQTRSNSPVS
jgi:peptidoglycan/LPS O-acetylase OafA/YrhL